MAATISTVPAVLDALVQRWTLALPGVQVSDGQPLDLAADMVLVGFAGEAGELAVTSTRSRQQMSSAPDREQYEITCLVSSWKGRVRDAKAVRDRAYELIDAMADDLAAAPTLDGLVMRARLSTESFTQYQTTDGATAVVQVTVAVDAFTRRT